MEYKTPKYTRDAIADYRKKIKVFQISVKLEEWERMQAVGMDAKSIKPLIIAELERRENPTKKTMRDSVLETIAEMEEERALNSPDAVNSEQVEDGDDDYICPF